MSPAANPTYASRRRRAFDSAPQRQSELTPSRAGALTIESCLLFLSMTGAWALSARFVNPIWSVVALANYIWMFVLFFRMEPRVTVLDLPQYISRASSVVALIFIEYGAPIPELGTVGEPGTTACSYVFYQAVLFAASTAAFAALIGPPDKERQHPLTPLYDRFANFLAFGILAAISLLTLYLIFRGLAGGFPLLTGTDRFLYRRLANDKIITYMLTYKYVVLFCLGMVSYCLPAIGFYKLSAKVLAAISVVVYFLFADKFFTQLVGISGFFAPYLYFNHHTIRKHLFLYSFGSAAALAMVFSVTWFIYSKGGVENSAAVSDRMSGRMVGQGELWFLQSRIGSPLLKWDKNFIERNFEILFIKQADLYALNESLGPNYYSNLYAPDKIRASLHRNAGSVSYTAALEPLGLMAFGWVGLAIMQAVLGIVMCLSTLFLAYTILSRSLISAILASYVWIQYRYFLSQGAPWVLFSIYSGKWLLVIAMLEMVLFVLGATQRRPLVSRRSHDRRRW